MIHIVNQSNRHLYARQIWDMNVVRHRSSVRPGDWDGLTVFDGAPIDDMDDERAVYLMALDDDGALQGAVRARPTDDKSLLFDRYPHLVAPDQPDLRGTQTWEGSRVFTTDAFRTSRQPGHRGFLGLNLASREVALDAGASRIVGMIDVRGLDRLTPIAPAGIRILGLPAEYGYGVMVGASVEVSTSSIACALQHLAEPVRISYEVSDDDLASFGSLAAVQQTVEAARWTSHDEAETSLRDADRAIAEAKALFAQHDLMSAGELEGWTG